MNLNQLIIIECDIFESVHGVRPNSIRLSDKAKEKIIDEVKLSSGLSERDISRIKTLNGLEVKQDLKNVGIPPLWIIYKE